MSEAFYYREDYYLLPDTFDSVDALKAHLKELPSTIMVSRLTENHGIKSIIQKGICIAPYFYSEYGFPKSQLVIEDIEDIYSVDVTLLSQSEYNKRLREVVLSFCPGCYRYKPLSNRVQSLNGHFEEIALNSVCFYRQERKPTPRVFREMLHSFGGMAHHFDPAAENTEQALDFIDRSLYLKYKHGEKRPNQSVLKVECLPNFFSEQLTASLSEYIEKHLYFTEFRLSYEPVNSVTKEQIETMLMPKKSGSFQKECKKYGVSVACMQFDAGSTGKVKRSIEPLLYHDYARLVYEEDGALYFLLMDQCSFIKAMHFRSPFLQSCNSKIEIHDQYGKQTYAISFDMVREDI